MLIGIDLDNTLVNYDQSFIVAAKFLNLNLPILVNTKTKIRDWARHEEGGEFLWQKLQGLAYGKFLNDYAKIYPGVIRFLWHCKFRAHKVKIVSHKTEYGHFDAERLPIRSIATNFLKSNGLLDSIDSLIADINFVSTLDAKVDEICLQNFDWFIDDLPDVIDRIAKCNRLKKILFDPDLIKSQEISRLQPNILVANDWQQVDTQINGEWTEEEVKEIASRSLKCKIFSSNKVTIGRNSRVYKLLLTDHTLIKMKIYPIAQQHNRLFSEYLATQAMSHLGIKDIPRPVAKDTHLGVGFFEWVDGKPIESHGPEEINLSLNFLRNLHALRNKPEFLDAPLASAACLSGRDIESQLKNRYHQFDEARCLSRDLDNFLKNNFLPVMDFFLGSVKKVRPKKKYQQKLSRDEQTLSPSDFGFHNMIKCNDGTITFLDFEYFGWDDPVKLVSDFLYHPAMTLTTEQKIIWIRGAYLIYGAKMIERLKIFHPLYGLIWCLILLNDFRRDIRGRQFLDDNSETLVYLTKSKIQLTKAKKLLKNIQKLDNTFLIEKIFNE